LAAISVGYIESSERGRGPYQHEVEKNIFIHDIECELGLYQLENAGKILYPSSIAPMKVFVYGLELEFELERLFA
jgi:hypothetical protein